MRFACITDFPIILSPYQLKIISGVVEECESHAIPCCIFGGCRQFRLKTRGTDNYDGYIFWAIRDPCSALEQLAAKIPSVWLLTPRRKPCNMVLIDSVNAVNRIVGHLYSEGFRRIGFLNLVNLPWAHERYEAFIQSIKKNQDLECKPGWVYGYGTNSRYNLPPAAWKDYGKCADDFLSRRDLPEAVVCANDGQAYALLSRALQKGMRVPQDIAVTGFDNRDYPGGILPRVTTARVDFQLLGRLAARQLFDILNGLRISTDIIRYRPDILVRQTSLGSSFNKTAVENEDFREIVNAHIYRRLSEPRLSRSISACCGYAHEYFLIKFSHTFGRPFTEYLNTLRIDQACSLLRDTRKTVSEIAFESGFQHLQNFYRKFSGTVGCTPTAYRRHPR
ncbi:MAG: hypothetical protein A2096_17440 [Spirochaetes bacterium GWF1_41_5]|nr:MAG: hypothetical protein A2096_17440 [Spirochaetes bacterium GWF1_41_5]HBE03951.1 hypothetical protein [Spirochaetia bacterium]